MKAKKATALCLALFFLLSSPAIVPSAGKPSGETAQTAPEQDPNRINKTTSIKNDFYYLGLKRVQYQNLSDLLRSELISMLYLDSSLYLYLAMPEDTDYDVNYIIINGHKYETGSPPSSTDHNYRKYIFSGFEEAADSRYTVSEIGFQNPSGEKIHYATKRECKMGFADGQYFFEQEAVNNIVLEGMLLESIYQFENERGILRDAWNNLWNNTTAKDGDQRSFYYFAFNCFDRQIDQYFTPDEITEIIIDYTINQYTFQGKKADYKKADLARTEKKQQIITPETIHVEAHDQKNSNDSPYVYNTIYKLSEAEIKESDKTANYNTLFTAQQKGFDWVVHFGDTQGYRYCESYTDNLLSDSCEIDYTKVEEFSAIHITYTYKGQEYSVPTDTLVDMEVVARREKDRTESLIKQVKDTVSFTAESLGNLFSGAVKGITSKLSSKAQKVLGPLKIAAGILVTAVVGRCVFLFVRKFFRK